MEGRDAWPAPCCAWCAAPDDAPLLRARLLLSQEGVGQQRLCLYSSSNAMVKAKCTIWHVMLRQDCAVKSRQGGHKGAVLY